MIPLFSARGTLDILHGRCLPGWLPLSQGHFSTVVCSLGAASEPRLTCNFRLVLPGNERHSGLISLVAHQQTRWCLYNLILSKTNEYYCLFQGLDLRESPSLGLGERRHKFYHGRETCKTTNFSSPEPEEGLIFH